MECEEAKRLIRSCQRKPELSAHLDTCGDCCEEHAFWNLLGEVEDIEPGLGLTERVLQEIKTEERRDSWDHIKNLVGRYFSGSGMLDEFSDFPPDSFGAVLFGTRRS